MLQVGFMCVELDKTWTFIMPHGGVNGASSESRTSKTSSGNFMIDSSSVTYNLSHNELVAFIPQSSLSSDFESAHSYIADCSDATSAYKQHLRPLGTTTLVRVPGDAGLTSMAMLHLHQLHSIQ